MPILKRLAETARAPVAFTLDGAPAQALMGDTVLTAVLTHIERVRRSEFGGGARAGFCMMGACQDCWMQLEDGGRLRACTTFIEPGMRLLSQWPQTWRPAAAAVESASAPEAAPAAQPTLEPAPAPAALSAPEPASAAPTARAPEKRP